MYCYSDTQSVLVVDYGRIGFCRRYAPERKQHTTTCEWLERTRKQRNSLQGSDSPRDHFSDVIPGVGHFRKLKRRIPPPQHPDKYKHSHTQVSIFRTLDGRRSLWVVVA